MTFSIQNFGNVPAQYQNNAAFTAAIVNDIYSQFPANYFRFTSGWRSAAANANANGVDNSFHLTGEAADLVPTSGRFPESDLNRIGKIVTNYGYEVIRHDAGSGLHYHIEPSPTGKHSPDGIIAGQSQNTGDSQTLVYAGLGILVLILLLD